MTRPPVPAPAGLAHRPPPRPTLAVATKVYPPVPPMPADVLVHPTANLMPMMTPQEFADLVERVKAHGLREPIKRLAGPHAGQWFGAIYDGRNRYLACLAAGREPVYEDLLWDGEQSLVELVLDLGVPRRSLTAAQKVIISEEMKPLLEAEAAERRARGLLRAQQLRAQHGDGPSPSAQVHHGAPAQPGVAEAQDDGEIHGGPPAKKRDEGGRTRAKLAKLAQVGEVSARDVTRILGLAPDLRPVLKLKGPLSIPQALTLATKFTAEDRAVAVDRILSGEKAAAVLADMTPFAAADPKVLTAKERSAARVLRGLSQERQQLVLAEGKVDLAEVPTPRSCTQPDCTAAKEGLRARPLTKGGGLSYWCKDHDPGPFPEPKRPRVLGELPYVFLWSHREKMWWAADRKGYTHEIVKAGLYAPDEAANLARGGESVPVPLTGNAPLPAKRSKRR